MCQPAKDSKKEPCKNQCPGCKKKAQRKQEKEQQEKAPNKGSSLNIPIQNL